METQRISPTQTTKNNKQTYNGANQQTHKHLVAEQDQSPCNSCITPDTIKHIFTESRMLKIPMIPR